ncbi:MAG: hypothetical protein AAGJ79_12610 [Verrucomicrobiota bacterium]
MKPSFIFGLLLCGVCSSLGWMWREAILGAAIGGGIGRFISLSITLHNSPPYLREWIEANKPT